MQSLRSGISPIAMGSCSFFEMQGLDEIGGPSLAKASFTGKPSARFPTVKGGLVPIAFGADSVAFGFASPPRARPLADAARLPRPRRGLDQNRNFLLCWEAELSTLP